MSPLIRTAVLAATFAAVLPAAAEDPQDDVALSLTCKGPLGTGRRQYLRFNGTGALPDLAVVKLSIHPMTEKWGADRIMSAMLPAQGELSQVKNRKFDLELPFTGPGLYSVKVDLIDEMQNPQLVQTIKGKYAPRTWSFKFHTWGDDLVEKLWPGLQELDLLLAAAREMLRKFEAACKSPEMWQAQAKALTEENQKLLLDLERNPAARAYFPAAYHQVHYTLGNVQTSSQYFEWANGKFAGAKDYHANDKKVETFRNEAFTYENLRRYIEEAYHIAGRELCLWIVKDARRAGEVRPEAVAAAKSAKAHAGVAEFAAQLEALKLEELDTLEQAVRRAKFEAAPEKK